MLKVVFSGFIFMLFNIFKLLKSGIKCRNRVMVVSIKSNFNLVVNYFCWWYFFSSSVIVSVSNRNVVEGNVRILWYRVIDKDKVNRNRESIWLIDKKNSDVVSMFYIGSFFVI